MILPLGFVYIANGSFSIQSEGDGISSSSILQVDNGSFSLQTGGGSANAPEHTSTESFRRGPSNRNAARRSR